MFELGISGFYCIIQYAKTTGVVFKGTCSIYKWPNMPNKQILSSDT